MDLAGVLHALYDCAGYDLRVDYRREPLPPLAPAGSRMGGGAASAAR